MNIHNSAEETTITKTRVVVSLSLSLSLPYTLPKSIVASSWLEEGRGYWVTVRQEWQGQARDNPSALMILWWLHHAPPLLPSTSSHEPSLCFAMYFRQKFLRISPCCTHGLLLQFVINWRTSKPLAECCKDEKNKQQQQQKKNRAAVCCIEFNILYNTVIYILLHQYYRTYRFRIIFIFKDYIYH